MLLFIVQLKASRLLKAADACPPALGPGICVELCTPGGCPGGQLCCSNGCGHTCQCPQGQCLNPDGNCGAFATCLIDPCDRDIFNRGGCSDTEICLSNYCGPTPCTSSCQACPDGQCANPQNQCAQQVNCAEDPCANNNGGCAQGQICTANYCGGCNAVCTTPIEGDPCGLCIRPLCLCQQCPNGSGTVGCCGDCRYVDDGAGNLNCQYVETATGCEVCGGFENCLAYNDGCNDCTCNPNGSEACTEKACLKQGEPKCIKFTCSNNSDCDTQNGFRCRRDPFCRGQDNNPLCDPVPKVCVDIKGPCASDSDCKNGYNCIGMNANGNGRCARYQERQ